MIIEGVEGMTHINIYSKSKTSIGKWLSNFTYCPISTEHGNFNSIEGYWYWLGTLNDNLRDLSGFHAKKLGRESEVLRELPEDVFQSKIKSAIDRKLKTKPKEVSEINLPICHYYEYGGKRVDAGYEWIGEHIEYRVEQLKEYYKNK
jgi:hypothetical protein